MHTFFLTINRHWEFLSTYIFVVLQKTAIHNGLLAMLDTPKSASENIMSLEDYYQAYLFNPIFPIM